MDSCRQCGCAVLPRTEMLRLGLRRPGNSWSSFRNEERVHLRDEEEELFPLLLRHIQSQPAPLREARAQHMQLEGFARKLDIAVAASSVDRETLDAAGELLDAHIRLEERQLFPLIEELVPDDELRRLGLADRDATCAVRRPPLTS
jgi:hypothetical protein